MNDKAADKAEPLAIKITQQYRARNGMTYELMGGGHRLTVRMFPRQSATDADEWRCEASNGPQRDEPLVVEWAASRKGALTAVARAWAVQAPPRGLPLFDWDAIAEVLQSVRAL